MAFPDAFASPRLSFERLTQGHFAEMRRFQGDPVVMRYIGGVRSEEQTVAYLERNLRHWDDHGFGVWVLREAGRPEMAGIGVLRHLLVDGEDEVETGYGFFPALWGKGYATEVAVTCLAHGFQHTGLDSIVAATHPDNRDSQHVLRKVGMEYEKEFVLDGNPTSLFRIRRPR